MRLSSPLNRCWFCTDTTAPSGLAGIVAAYITLHRHAKVNLPSGHLLTDALLRPDAASVELCCDRREGKPPVVDEMVKKGRACFRWGSLHKCPSDCRLLSSAWSAAHQLPRYGLEARPPGEREQLVPFTFRLLTADHLARFTLTHTLVDVQLQAADFPAHLLHTTPEFRNAMRRARMPRHTYTAVHPTTIAFWAVEVLCYLEKVLEASFGACYVLRVINIFERESRASGYKDVWIAEEMWSLCLKAVERNGELEVLRDGVHKLKDEDFICTLAEWEIGMHGGDRTALEASYRQTFSMFAEIITVRQSLLRGLTGDR